MKRVAVLCCLATIGACGMFESDGMKPGEWRTTTEIESFEAPGMPASVVERMKEAAKGATVEVCMTKEMAASPSADTFAPRGGGCISSQFEIKDGKLAAKMSCAAGGATQDIVMEGTIEPELYTIRSTVNSSMLAGKTKMVTKIESRRIGDC